MLWWPIGAEVKSKKESEMRELIFPKSLPAPRFRYTPCVKTGPFYQMAGMIALDPKDNSKLVAGGAEGETRRILQNLKLAAGDLGLQLTDLVSATIYTTKFQEFPQINKVWEEFFDDRTPPPARTSIGVAALPLNAAVEMEFRFYKE
jgi:2-iminobutanoate/2-iminopropanoate deaminase